MGQIRVRVEPSVPKEGTTAYADVVEVFVSSLGGEERHKFPGTTYRATKPDEQPTHYPEVKNGHGTMGFVVLEKT